MRCTFNGEPSSSADPQDEELFFSADPQNEELFHSLSFLFDRRGDGISMDELCLLNEVVDRVMEANPEMREAVEFLTMEINQGEEVIHVQYIAGESGPFATLVQKLALCNADRGGEYYIARIPGWIKIEGKIIKIEMWDIVAKKLLPFIIFEALPIPFQVLTESPIVFLNDTTRDFMEYGEFQHNASLATEQALRLHFVLTHLVRDGPYVLVREPRTLRVRGREIVVEPGDLVRRDLLEPPPSRLRRAWNALRFWRR
jgi:hypothetical protein